MPTAANSPTGMMLGAQMGSSMAAHPLPCKLSEEQEEQQRHGITSGGKSSFLPTGTNGLVYKVLAPGPRPTGTNGLTRSLPPGPAPLKPTQQH